MDSFGISIFYHLPKENAINDYSFHAKGADYVQMGYDYPDRHHRLGSHYGGILMPTTPLSLALVCCLCAAFLIADKVGNMKKHFDFGFVFWFAILGIVVVGLFTFGTPYMSDTYKGSGAVIGMVNPTGNDPARDLTYSQVNQGNSGANLTNAYAYRINATMWLLFLVVPALIGIVLYIVVSRFGKGTP